MGYRENKKESFIAQAREKNVICFGTGNIFREFLEFAKNEDIVVSYACDNDDKKWGQSIGWGCENITVVSPDRLLDKNIQDAVIIITCTQVREIYQQLQKMKIEEKDIYVFPFLTDAIGHTQKMYHKRIAEPARVMLDTYLREFQMTSKQKEIYVSEVESLLERRALVMPYMTMLVTSKCTLRCRDCNNLIPFCNGGRTLGVKQILSDLCAISEAVDCCICVNITGGEPFLHPDFGTILREVISCENFLFVEVITNGTILPKAEWIEYLRHPKVILKVSEYPEYTKTDEVEEFLRKHNILFQLRQDLQWVTSGGIERRHKQYEQIVNEYLRCWSGKYCKSIWDGKLYACARAAFLHDIMASNHVSDYVELHLGQLKENLLHHMLSPYADACDFCDHMSPQGKNVKAAIQVSI